MLSHRSAADSRRRFLKASGVTVALPLLESVRPLRARAEAAAGSSHPQRLVCVGNSFGMYQPAFFPKSTGEDYETPELLKPLAEYRDNFSILSGLDHGVTGGHFAVHSFLTGVLSVDAKHMPDGNISLDQRAAESIGSLTRFPTLNVGCQGGLHNGCQMSWTRSGVRVPPIPGPRELFRKLFIDDSAAGRRTAAERSALKQSILDSVLGDANSLAKRVGNRDRQKLEEYFTAVRDAERTVTRNRHWQGVEKPDAPIDQPPNRGIVEDLPVLYDLIALALQTDSTRIATLEISSEGFDTSVLGVDGGYHSISHHGQRQEKIDALVMIERYQTEHFARFLDKLKSLDNPATGRPLLEDTVVMFGSGMGNGNSHTNTNLPILLAGGGFQHGRHLAYPTDQNRRVPLSNLYVSILQRLGIEADYFASSTGTLRDLSTA